MKKFLSFLCCLTLMLNFFSVSTFAAKSSPENTISTRATSQGLWYKDGW